MSEETKQHVRCVFFGRVQGVGFRYTTLHLARGYDVVGYVRNTPEGSVELVVEGSAGDIADFIAEIEKRMAGYVRDKQVSRSDDIVGFKEFDIRF